MNNRLTAAQLGSSWDENAEAHGLTGVMVLPSSVHGGAVWGLAVQSAFFPLYLTAVFHDCRNCGGCCRAFDSRVARGVEVTRTEAQQLQTLTRVTKRAGKYFLKYPCAIQKNNKCVHYLQRPFSCRAFPVVNEGTSDDVELAVYMACPAGRETFIKASLFLQDANQLAVNNGRLGQGVSLADLDRLAEKYQPRLPGAADRAFIEKTAREMGLG